MRLKSRLAGILPSVGLRRHGLRPRRRTLSQRLTRRDFNRKACQECPSFPRTRGM